MGATPDQLKQLAEPTPEAAKKTRPGRGRSGQLTYVDARFVMERLDQTVGVANWQDAYRKADESKDGIVGRIGILVERDDGEEWVWKEDVGTESNIEETKGSYSDAFKRAAVKWGVGRDLYPGGIVDALGPSAPANLGPVAAAVAKVPKPKSITVSKDDATWVCPEHDAVVAWPAGETVEGRKYDAFYACPKGKACEQRAPAGLPVKPEHLKKRLDDDLPF